MGEKKERIQSNIQHMQTNLERIEKSSDKAEKERLQKAMKLRLQAIKKIKSEDLEKTEHDLEKLAADTTASALSEEKKERILSNVDHMKQTLERIEKSSDKAEKER